MPRPRVPLFAMTLIFAFRAILPVGAQGLFDFGGEAARLFDQGVAAQEAGDLKEAAALYRKAIEVEPKHFNSHNNLGALYAGKGFHAKAVENFRGAVKANPQFVEGWANLGRSLVVQRRRDQAIEALEEGLAANPDSPAMLTHLAAGLRERGDKERGDLDRADRLVAKAKAAGPAVTADGEADGYLLEQQGDLAGAEKAYLAAIRSDPTMPAPMVNLGLMLTKQKRWEEAERLFEKGGEA